MNYIFLLGGKDLEMVEIKKMLEEEGKNVLDKDLSWGAKLSDYQKELKELDRNCTVVGIELQGDIDVKNDYIEVDHHNENINKESSIEQIADLLGIELTRYQKMVSENDKGYIDALKDFGANQEEIEEIRRADRKNQGVSEEDEKLAEESLRENKEGVGGVIIVKSKTDKFSPICDRLYPTDKLIVYTDNELNYYGQKAQKLGEKYKTEYGKDKVYYGGGEDGYFGFSNGALDSEEIQEKVREVVEFVGEGDH
ncbi:hypothetical protein [Halonatronum saccharophilum]|uniref:hypothetical protein n=1 Tax=Halonatronum saccharophilum TaxID=150060 RepID=UPI0004B7607A|nr:hypothetical protein [Halonatronum saccharophilum]